jgi:hypothetical protein
VIRIRSAIERGCAHPVFGPLVVLAVLVLLAFVFLHFAHEGLEVAELGAACLALATVLVVALVERPTPPVRACPAVATHRGPPGSSIAYASTAGVEDCSRNLPLRR